MSDRDSYLYDLMRGRTDEPVSPRVVDLGSDVLITFTTALNSDVEVGFIETHPTPEGAGCQGQVVFDIPEAAHLNGPKWQLVSRDPLHIEPSVLCRSCGHHGFVRDGRWEGC
jgi:hypothetical protein